MTNITSTKILYLKGLLFLIGGIIASAILIIEHPGFKAAVLLAASVWCFARSYYFAFYVIEHYIDENYKFSGLWSFAVYMFRKKKGESRRYNKDCEQTRQ
jgi:hypothetical protein